MALRFDFLLLVLGRCFTALISVASLRIMTTLLSPRDYGQLAILIAFQVFCGLFLINPVDQYFFRHAHTWWDQGTLLSYFAKFEQYLRLVSLFITCAVILFWWQYSQTPEHSSIKIALSAGLAVGLIVYVGTLNTLLVTLLNVLGFRMQSVILMITSVSISLLCSVLWTNQYPHAFTWLAGQSSGAILAALGAWWILSKHSVNTYQVPFSNFLNRKTILTFCLPLALATGFMWLQNTGYRFWVGSIWGEAKLGILIVGLGISAQLAAIVEGLAMQFLYPYFARRVTNTTSDAQISLALSDLMNALAPIYAIWAGLNAVSAVSLIKILTDERYHVAIPFVILGAIIEFFRCITNLWSNTARAIHKTKGLIFPYAFGAITVWMGIIAISYFDASLTNLTFILILAGIVTCFSMIILMQRLLVLSIDKVRFSISLTIMLICFAFAFKMPIHTSGLTQNLVLLFISGSLAGCFMLALLWRNPALIRLLSASLRTN